MNASVDANTGVSEVNDDFIISLINDIKLASDTSQRGPINLDWRQQNAAPPAINRWTLTVHPDVGALGYDIEIILPRFATNQDEDNEKAGQWLGNFLLELSESRGDAAYSIDLDRLSDGTTMKVTRAA
jgi:hypothetical protein